MNQQRRIERSGLLLFIIGSCFLIFAIQPPASIKKIAIRANEDMSMDGLIFDHHEAGRRLFSVKAAKFSLGKAKVGFFHIGLFKSAGFEQMEIDFYPPLAAPDRPPVGSKEIRNPGLEKNLDELTGALRIKHLMRLTARDFVLRVHEDGKLVSVIEAGMAFFEPGQGKIILRKEVRVSAYEAGEKVLRCNELHVEDGRLSVKGSYAVTAANGIERGENLQSDFLLSNFDNVAKSPVMPAIPGRLAEP